MTHNTVPPLRRTQGNRVAALVLPWALWIALALVLPVSAGAVCSSHFPSPGETVTCDTTDPNPDPQSIVGGGPNVTVNVLSGAGIQAPLFAIDSGGGGGWTIDNAGSISGASSSGIVLSGGSIVNHADAQISGTVGIFLQPGSGESAASVVNAGTVTGSPAIDSAFLDVVNLTLQGSSILNGDVVLGGATNTLHLQGNGSEDSSFTGVDFIVVMDGAQWTLSGHVESPGPLAVGADGEGVLSVSGDVDIGGGGGLSKLGGGSLVLSGVTFTNGPISIHEGLLQVDGSLPSSTLTQLFGGRLAGVGSLGSLAASGGVVSPGPEFPGLGIGSLHTGSVDLQAAATLQIRVAGLEPGFAHDQLHVTGGTVSIQNATLFATVTFAVPPGSEIVILKNDGGGAVSGQFSGLPEGALTTINDQQFQITYAGGDGNDVALRRLGPGAFSAMALLADPEPMISDGNGVFEPGERVEVAPVWQNAGAFSQLLTGTASDFTGPAGPDYTLVVDTADYGEVEPGASASCEATGMCYQMDIGPEGDARPAAHWDAVFDETLSDETAKTWALHIGDSFTDVPRSSLFYRWIETLLHHGVTGGCTPTQYCPAGGNTRAQMAVFLLKALEGGTYLPPACVDGEEIFADVPFDNPFCRWIEELAGRGVTAGCGGGNYCPNASVNRDQMAVFLLKALGGPSYTPPACTGVFTDVPCPSLFANWVEDLVSRGITAGCGGGNYCPANPVTRDQMAVFVSKTFGLTLYGP